MEYAKSQILKIIEENKPIVFKALETIDENVAYINTEKGYNIKCQMYVDGALEKLRKALEALADLIIDTDDYPLGLEISEKLMPVWRKYCTGATRGEFRIHDAAHQVQSIINYFQKWVKKNEPKSSVKDSLVAFEELAHECIAFIGLKYGTRKERSKSQDLILKQKDLYQKMAHVSDLTYEIKRSIENCNSPSETDQFICSLLMPFKELCSVLRPPTPTEESQRFIRLLCTGTNYHGANESDSIERILRNLLYEMNKFAKGLYDVLIQNGLDLNEYQQKTGVYLRRKWNPAEGAFFEVDNWDLLENLPLVEKTDDAASEQGDMVDYSIDANVLVMLANLYGFLIKEEVIPKDYQVLDYINAIRTANISDLYFKSKRAKFRSTIKAIEKYFSKEWFKAVCKSANITEDNMGKFNIGDETATEQWRKNLNKIVAV